MITIKIAFTSQFDNYLFEKVKIYTFKKRKTYLFAENCD